MADQLSQLRTFLSIARTESITKAAHLSRRDPAVLSRRLQALEDRLGVRLLERTTRQVVLTEAGRQLAARVSPILDELAAAETHATSYGSDVPRGQLRVTAPTSFGRRWITPLIPGFLATYPETTVYADYSDRHVDLVGEGYDAAIRIGALPNSTMRARRIATHRRVICAAPSFVASRGEPAEPAALARQPCLAFGGRRDPDRWRFSAGGPTIEIKVECRILSNDADLLVEAARAGAGILKTTDWHVHDDLERGTLVELLPDWQRVDAGGVHIVMPSTTGPTAKTRAFVNWIERGLRRGNDPMPFA